MYTDLRKYTTTTIQELNPDSYGGYVKRICEHSRNKKFVDELIKGINYSVENGYFMEDFDLLNNLISDFYVVDALNTDDNIMLRLILSCFVDDFILETDCRTCLEQYIEYTSNGLKAQGLKENFLSEFIKNEFKDFHYLSIFGQEGQGDLSAEGLIKMIDSGEIEGFIDDNIETVMYSAFVVIDEKEDNTLLEDCLDQLGFTKVIDGFYYYGCFGYDDGCGELDISFNYIAREEFFGLLDCTESTNLSQHDEVFSYLNEENINGKVNVLIRLLDKCESSKEVMF